MKSRDNYNTNNVKKCYNVNIAGNVSYNKYKSYKMIVDSSYNNVYYIDPNTYNNINVEHNSYNELT